MPIYEYICGDCQQRFEHFFRSRQENQEVACTHCGGRNIRRIFSTFGVGGDRGADGSSSETCGTCATKTCSTCR